MDLHDFIRAKRDTLLDAETHLEKLQWIFAEARAMQGALPPETAEHNRETINGEELHLSQLLWAVTEILKLAESAPPKKPEAPVLGDLVQIGTTIFVQPGHVSSVASEPADKEGDARITVKLLSGESIALQFAPSSIRRDLAADIVYRGNQSLASAREQARG